MSRKNVIWTDRAKAELRAIDQQTAMRVLHSLARLTALGEGDVERATREKKEGPELSIFLVRDHGALLKVAGKARNALQYDIGNPVTASLMTRYRLAAALYAPIRVVLSPATCWSMPAIATGCSAARRR